MYVSGFGTVKVYHRGMLTINTILLRTLKVKGFYSDVGVVV